jgi:hypothetical protein
MSARTEDQSGFFLLAQAISSPVMNLCGVGLVAFLFISWTQSAFPQQSKVHPALWQKAQVEGLVP